MAFFSSCKNFLHLVFLSILLNTFRSFAGNKHSTIFLSSLAIGSSIANGLSRPLWGILYDRYGFKQPFIMLNVLQFIVAASIYFSVEVKMLFSFLIILSGGLQAGLFALFPSLISKIFGVK